MNGWRCHCHWVCVLCRITCYQYKITKELITWWQSHQLVAFSYQWSQEEKKFSHSLCNKVQLILTNIGWREASSEFHPKEKIFDHWKYTYISIELYFFNRVIIITITNYNQPHSHFKYQPSSTIDNPVFLFFVLNEVISLIFVITLIFNFTFTFPYPFLYSSFACPCIFRLY